MVLEKLTEETLVCPITQTLLENAVVGRSGHTFSEPAIRKWLNQQKTNPLTREPMSAKELVPNYVVHDVVQILKEQGAV
jgi:hypothetical protein